MRKILRIAGIILVLGFVMLQFFSPEKNKSEMTEAHIFQQEQVPDHIRTILKEACLDCHSDNTRYTWYHFVPVSWMVKRHIDEGKKELNFSQWGSMDVFDKITILEESCQETERQNMPLKSYGVVHPKARLSEEQVAALCDWTTRLSEELLARAMEE